MMQKLNDWAKSFAAKVILSILILSFLLWGIQSYFGGGDELPVATVGDHQFFQRDVTQAYERIAQNPAVAQRFSEEQLRRQALDQLIRDQVVMQTTQALGMAVSDITVRDYIRSLSYFQSEGKFDEQKYQRILSSQRKSSPEFFAQVRQSMEMEQFRQGITESGFITDFDTTNFYRLFNQQRTIEYFVVPVKSDESPINDTAIEQYYRDHEKEFETPEQVSVDYIELSMDELAQSVQPTEDALQSYYEDQKASYSSGERRKISHILIKLPAQADPDAVKEAEAKIGQIQQRLLESGDAFADVARELSEDAVSAKKGGDLGLISRNDMEKYFDEAAFSLAEGEISKPVRTSFGFHLITVTELQPGETKPLAEVRDKVEQGYRRSVAENLFYEAGEQLSQLSYENPDSLDAAAQELKLKINQSPLFSRTKKSEEEGIAKNDAVRSAAFTQELLSGINSEPIELDAEKVVVLHLNQHQPAQLKPLDEVRDSIVSAIRQENAKSAAEEKAEQLLARLKSGEQVNELATTEQLKLEKPEPIKRGQPVKSIPFQLVQAVFKAPKPTQGAVTPLLVKLPDGSQAVVELSVVIDGEVDKENLEAAKQQLVKTESNLLYSSMIEQLRSEADVTINQPSSTQ